MTLRVPEEHKPTMAFLAAMPSGDRQRLLSAISDSAPAIGIPMLARSVGQVVELQGVRALEVMTVLATLYVMSADDQKPPDQMAREVADAVEEAELAKWAEGDRADFERFISSALSLHDQLGVAAKAFDVLIQDAHPFKDARVVTDFRPVFIGPDTDPDPRAGMIIHNLKITSFLGAIGDHDYFVALDSTDVRTLRKVLDRALQKERALKKLMERTGVRCIDRSLWGEED